MYNKGYLYSRDAAVSLKVLPLHTGTEAFQLPSTHSSERLPTNLYPTLHSKDAIAPCENRVPYFRPFKGSVIFWHWARKYTATNNVIDYNYVYVTYVHISIQMQKSDTFLPVISGLERRALGHCCRESDKEKKCAKHRKHLNSRKTQYASKQYKVIKVIQNICKY